MTPAAACRTKPRWRCACTVVLMSAAAQGVGAEYSITSITAMTNGVRAVLDLVDEELPEYGPSSRTLVLNAMYESNERLHIRILDEQAQAWETPEDILPTPGPHPSGAPSPLYALHLSDVGQPFGLRVDRRTSPSVLPSSVSSSSSASPPPPPAAAASPSTITIDNSTTGTTAIGKQEQPQRQQQDAGGVDTVFDMSRDLPFVFKEQYIEFSTRVAKGQLLFGMGESSRRSMHLSPGSTYTLWARDAPSAAFDTNTYGSHPFYLQADPAAHGSSVGVFLRNSHGMDVTYTEQDTLKFQVLGGVVDLYILMGPSPTEVVRQYSGVVGRPAMMPYWALGFHNCRWGYSSVGELEEVVANYTRAEIPLDGAWADIDYMDLKRDFTTDPVAFPLDRMQSYVKGLHMSGRKAVLIVDPGIAAADSYEAYARGVAEDIFIKGIDGKPYIGAVWPGLTSFPDFLHGHASKYWENSYATFHSQLPFDGSWIDMNEVSNFCNTRGDTQVCSAETCPESDCAACCRLIDGRNKYDFPPYPIHNGEGLLGAKTMPPSATHHDGTPLYATHNLYGIMQSKATHNTMANIRKQRPFVLSRSTFAGSGRYAAHWTGDNAATWADLQVSIRTMLQFSLFNIPMVGADICGFIGDTNEELCTRWVQLGAFYPFSRVHNNNDAIPQELYRWESVAAAARKVLSVRYALLPYLYTMFFRAHMNASMVARPLWANFPHDPDTFMVDQQFMLGDALLISPVTQPSATHVTAYFPMATTWFSFFDMNNRIDTTDDHGTWAVLHTPITDTQVHVRGGCVVPMQVPALTTTAARANPFHLLVALDAHTAPPGFTASRSSHAGLCSSISTNATASTTTTTSTDSTAITSKAGASRSPKRWAAGELVVDDGEELQMEHYTLLSFAASECGVTASVDVNKYIGASDLHFERVVVLNLGLDSVNEVNVNGEPISDDTWSYYATTGELVVIGLRLPLDTEFRVTWK